MIKSCFDFADAIAHFWLYAEWAEQCMNVIKIMCIECNGTVFGVSSCNRFCPRTTFPFADAISIQNSDADIWCVWCSTFVLLNVLKWWRFFWKNFFPSVCSRLFFLSMAHRPQVKHCLIIHSIPFAGNKSWCRFETTMSLWLELRTIKLKERNTLAHPNKLNKMKIKSAPEEAEFWRSKRKKKSFSSVIQIWCARVAATAAVAANFNLGPMQFSLLACFVFSFLSVDLISFARVVSFALCFVSCVFCERFCWIFHPWWYKCTLARAMTSNDLI